MFLCHPFLVHAASWPHRGRTPDDGPAAVLLLSEFPLHALSADAVTPVEQAILDGLALAADRGVTMVRNA